MATPENLVDVTTNDHFKEQLGKDLTRVSLVNFWASWAEPCKQMNEVVAQLAAKYPTLLVLQVAAEDLPDITESFEIEAVPSFVVLRGHTLLARVSGADAPTLTAAIAQHIRAPVSAQSTSNQLPSAAPAEKQPEETQEQLNDRLRKLMGQSKVVVFMKGEPDAPRCGFSRKTVELLRENEVQFTHFDILSDENVRSGLKVLNDWPTFPQIIVNGELVGGLDILRESVQSGEFKQLVAA